MIPVLYDESLPAPRAGHAAIENLGKGKVTETISCTIHEELNGDHYLELKYPVTGVLYPDLMNGGTILVHCPRHPTGGVDSATRGFDLFDIRKKSLPIDGVVTFTAQHISRRLSKAVVTSRFDGSWSNPPFRNSVPNSFNGVEFVMDDEMGTSTWITPTAPRSALACLIGDEESIVSTFGGDVVFSCYYVSGRYNIEVHAIWDNVGEDRGASVRFGVNMMSLDHTKDSTSAYNAVVPFWDDGNGNITYVTGYVVQPTTPISPVTAVPLDLTNEFETQPTEAQMVQAARDHLDNLQPWLGDETIKVDFVNDITDPHAPEILLGDTIHVYWGDADIATDLRVVAYDYNVLAERYISLELGTPQTQYVAVTGESYAGASGGGGGGSNSDYTIYDSVSDLGLSVGSATITGAWNALTAPGILLAPATNFASAGVPNTNGNVEICKTGYGGWIFFHGNGAQHHDYRMYISGGAPSGTWIRLEPIGLLDLATNFSVGINSSGNLYIRSVASGGTIYQLSANSSGRLNYEKRPSGGSWTTIWQK